MKYIVTNLKAIKKEAEENNIPIMDDDGLKFLTNYILDNNVKTLLELGTATGYSAINMALVRHDIVITTIERDKDRYLQALKNIKAMGLEKRINLVLGDALDINIEENYDLVFIDAAKGQYIKFFEKYANHLNKNGSIITDNIYFHGLVEQEDKIESKNLRQLVGKIRDYISFLETNKQFKTEFYKIGDGISVSRRET